MLASSVAYLFVTKFTSSTAMGVPGRAMRNNYPYYHGVARPPMRANSTRTRMVRLLHHASSGLRFVVNVAFAVAYLHVTISKNTLRSI